MVVAAPTTPLPALSKGDKLRLTLYFSLGQSVEALALELLDIHRGHQSHLANPTQPPAPFSEALTTENTALAPILSSPSSSALSTQSSAPPDSYDLAAWTLSDPIAPHIAYRRAEHLEQRKQRALAELDTILADAASSPIEKRRAATTMLRMLQNPEHPRPHHQRNRSSHPPPSGGGAALRGGGGSVSTPSTHSPSTNSNPASPLAHDAGCSTPSPHLRSSASSTSASPLSTPNPSLSPQQVITHILRALEQPENPAHLATFESFLSPEATIHDEPARPPLNPDQEAADPTTGETYTQLITPANSPATFKVTLTRPTSGAHRNCWLLQSLDPDTT